MQIGLALMIGSKVLFLIQMQGEMKHNCGAFALERIFCYFSLLMICQSMRMA